MNAKPYRLIFILLVAGLFSALILQAFWIRNFYFQKKEQLTQTIYQAMEQVSNKLNERENIRQIKKDMGKTTTIRIGHNGTEVTRKVTSQNIVVVDKKRIKAGQVISLDSIKQFAENMAGPNAGAGSYRPNISRVYSISADSKKENRSQHEKDILIDKMIFEIEVMETEEPGKDSLAGIIKRVLNNKGLFLPFEFALKKIFHNKNETIAQSDGFDANAKSFITDLSLNKVFNTHKFLYMQFPRQSNVVFSSMKNILFLSLLFSLMMIGVFYYSLRLIFKQKKLSEIRNDFVNNMTHELKTPIATISLALDAIKNPFIKNDDEKFNEYNRILKEENLKLNKHVERVLQMALLDKGELPLIKKQADLVYIMKAAIDSYKLQIAERRAKLEFVPSTESMMIVGDEQHLQTVFSNLLDNALKYTKSECRILISMQREENGIKISFRDNGIGIDKEHREKVFDKFYRVQGGNLHDVKGFGLGLSYVKSIVEAHQGTIELLSEKGKGSEFVIRFKIT